MYSKIIGTGGYLPNKILTNKDLESLVDTTDEWIIERTGIKQRHISEDGKPLPQWLPQLLSMHKECKD